MKPPATLEAVLEVPFRLDSILPTAAPDGSDGAWCSYVITQGTNQITGLRAGTPMEVKVLLMEMVDRLNERREGKLRKAR